MVTFARREISSVIILSLLLFFAAAVRMHTFYLPHNHGDQIFYLGLAMKLEKFGLKGYNLIGIDVFSNGDILSVASSDGDKKGSLLEGVEKSGVSYYSKEPLSNMPPAFSYLLMFSRRLFGPRKGFFTVVRNLGPRAIFLRPNLFLRTQFYAVLINFIFSLFFILTIFFLGKALFNEKIGLWAALLVAMSPVDILTSQRLWTDEPAAFFVALCVLLFWYGRKNKNLIFVALSGTSAGLAAVTKGTGLFIIITLVLYMFLMNLKTKELIVFVLSAVSVCGFWYAKIASVYGYPWYVPRQEGIENVSDWFAMLNRRPWYGQLYYFVYLVPLFILFYLEAAITLFKRYFTPERLLCLSWFFFFVLFLILIPAKEERYMLPAYPPIAIFSGIAIENIRGKLNALTRARHLGDAAIVLTFAATCVWSVRLGLGCVFDNLGIFNMF